jgi:hypothetical protein
LILPLPFGCYHLPLPEFSVNYWPLFSPPSSSNIYLLLPTTLHIYHTLGTSNYYVNP